MKRTIAILVVACVAAVAASTAGAARAGRVCPTFHQGGTAYHPETLGTGWTCASAKSWIVKLIGDRVTFTGKNIPLKNGPAGLHCLADNSLRGHASSGACFKGTIAFPGSGFAWING
jgi:hypothetical protein